METVERKITPSYLMDIDRVPEGVDSNLAALRNLIIKGFRDQDQDLDAEDAYRLLIELYLEYRDTANGATEAYLAESIDCFPADAGMTSDVTCGVYNGR